MSKVRNVFYIGTSLEHYRYFNGWHPKTRAVQGSKTGVLFKHKYITAPTVTPADAIVQAAKELEDVTKNKIPPTPAKSGIDRLKECTNIFGSHFTTAEEAESTDPPRMGTKEGATFARVEKENKSSAQTWQQTDKKQHVS